MEDKALRALLEGRDCQNYDGLSGRPGFAVCWGELAVLLLLGAPQPWAKKNARLYRKMHELLVISEGNPGCRTSWF